MKKVLASIFAFLGSVSTFAQGGIPIMYQGDETSHNLVIGATAIISPILGFAAFVFTQVF